MRIVIVGGGVAGMAAALALAATHQVEVFERSLSSAAAGMAFILVPAVHQDLKALGFGASTCGWGRRLRRFLMRDPSGQVRCAMELPPGTVGMLRRDLLTKLADRVDSRCLHAGRAVVGYVRDDTGDIGGAMLEDGALIEADLFIAADGVRSRARSVLFPDWPSPSAQVQELVGLAEDDELPAWAGEDFNKFQRPDGGVALGMFAVDARRVVWYVQFDSHRFAPPGQDAGAKRRFLQYLVGDWAYPVPRLLSRTEFAGVHLWRPLNADLTPSFHEGNLVLAGDAAHPLLPFTSQGVSCAVGDALALGSLLEPIDRRETLAAALRQYSGQRRAARLPFIHQGRDLSARFLRDQCLDQCCLPIAG